MSCAAQRAMRRRRQMLLWWRSPRCLLAASIIQTHNMCSLACLRNLLSRSRHTIPAAPPPLLSFFFLLSFSHFNVHLNRRWRESQVTSHCERAWCNERVAVNKQRRALAFDESLLSFVLQEGRTRALPTLLLTDFFFCETRNLKGTAHWSNPAQAKQKADAQAWRDSAVGSLFFCDQATVWNTAWNWFALKTYTCKIRFSVGQHKTRLKMETLVQFPQLAIFVSTNQSPWRRSNSFQLRCWIKLASALMCPQNVRSSVTSRHASVTHMIDSANQNDGNKLLSGNFTAFINMIYFFLFAIFGVGLKGHNPKWTIKRFTIISGHSHLVSLFEDIHFCIVFLELQNSAWLLFCCSTSSGHWEWSVCPRSARPVSSF